MILVGVGAGVWYRVSYRTDVDLGLRELRAVYRQGRPFEARLSLLGYAPFLNPRGKEEESRDGLDVDLAGTLLLEGDKTEHSAKSHHALGLYYATRNEFDRATRLFKDSLALEPRNALVHNDLAAVYLQHAVISQTPDIGDLAKSLEELNVALEIDGAFTPAYFNRALCLGRMSLISQAKDAWENYLKRDADSQWSSEAHKNLGSIQEAGISKRTPDEIFHDFMEAYRHNDETQAWRIQSQTKEMITESMVPFQLAQRYITASLSNQDEASREILGALKFSGELETQHNSDPFFAELAEFYRGIGEGNVASLAHAQESMNGGYKLCLEPRYQDAIQSFQNARSLFLGCSDMWEARVADYWIAYCLSQQGKLKRSSSMVSALAETSQRRHYRWLEVQSYCWLAVNSDLLGEYSTEVEQDQQTLNMAKASGDSYIQQKALSQLGYIYRFLGRLEDAVEFNGLSLSSADTYFISQRQFWRSLDSAARTLYALRSYAAAEAYEREALGLAREFDDRGLIHSSCLRLGQICAGQRDYSKGLRYLELSLKAIEPIANDPATRKLHGLSVLQIGNLRRLAGDGASALESYEEAAREFYSSEYGLYNYLTLKGRFLCHLLDKDDIAIERELPGILDLYERNRKEIREEQNRNQFFDAEQDVYDLAVDYGWGRKDNERSFGYAEFSRARSLLDVMAGVASPGRDDATDVVLSAVSQPLNLSQLKKRLPAEVQLLEYSVLPDRLLIWVITRERFETVESPVPAATLEGAIGEYLHSAAGGDNDSIERERQLAVQLHDWLFAPLEGCLNKGKQVAIVPDKALCKLPFAALLSRASGRRVVEDYTLFYSPSASVLVLCSDLARMKTDDKEGERLLIVGNPGFDRGGHPGLRDLPSAAMEATGIARFYHNPGVLTGRDALKDRVKAALREADVIHFSGHYLADSVSSARSKFLLASTGERTTDDAAGDISLGEVQTMRLPNARLAILSACQTGIERYYAGEGLIGLSRAFVTAGVPIVVASQWAVESESTAELMIDFHRFRREQNLSTAEALRQAQRKMLSGNDLNYRRPYYWAGFSPMGGYAPY